MKAIVPISMSSLYGSKIIKRDGDCYESVFLIVFDCLLTLPRSRGAKSEKSSTHRN